MKEVNLYNITLIQIKIFTCCAECGTFTAAAERLHFTQSMVSKSIAALEKELGFSLFLRGKKGCELTPSGRVLYDGWGGALDTVRRSIRSAAELDATRCCSLDVGYMDCLMDDSLFIGNIRKFRRKYPDVALNTVRLCMGELFNLASKSESDIIFTAKFDAAGLEAQGYTCLTVLDTFITIYVPDTNHLFSRESLSFADLKNETFIALSPETTPNYVAHLKEMCAGFGFEPKISAYARNALSFETNLLAGDSVVMADNNTAIRDPRIKPFVQRDIPSDAIMAWNDKSANPYVKKFVELVKEGIHSKQE